MRVLIVDCFDSFTYNLYQQVGQMGCEPVVVTCDAPMERIRRLDPDRIILSPGPGKPEEAGVCREVVSELGSRIPIIGVCLGHQVICTTFGGRVVRAPRPVHGKTSLVEHDGRGIFEGVENPFTAGRYHSLVADPGSLPEELEVCARSLDDRCIMGIRHRHLPVQGIQFHPESILTPEGDLVIRNFIGGGGR